MGIKPLYTVVVPTYNRSSQLEKCLSSLVSQNILPELYEIVIVNDGSIDDTTQVVQTFIDRHPPNRIRMFSQENKGCAAARNIGISHAQGDTVFFTDDDCIVPPNWIESHLDAYQQFPEAAGVGGWYWPLEDDSGDTYSFFYKLQFELAYPNMAHATVYTNTMNSPAGNTANMSYKKVLFEKLGGFDPQMSFIGGEDWDFKAKVVAHGEGLVSIPLHVVHVKKLNFYGFVKKSTAQGQGIDYWCLKYGQEYSLGVYISIFTLVFRWYKNPFTNGKDTGTYILWLCCVRFGRLLNRIKKITPKKIVSPVVSERFTKVI